MNNTYYALPDIDGNPVLPGDILSRVFNRQTTGDARKCHTNQRITGNIFDNPEDEISGTLPEATRQQLYAQRQEALRSLIIPLDR